MSTMQQPIEENKNIYITYVVLHKLLRKHPRTVEQCNPEYDSPVRNVQLVVTDVG